MPVKNFRKRKAEEDEHDDDKKSEDEEERRLALEEVKLLQKQRERKSGIPASTEKPRQAGIVVKCYEKVEVDGDKEELVLQDTFAQETAVMVEDPNMVRYIEQELAKRRGKNINSDDEEQNEIKRAEDELYQIPDHLKVKKRNGEETSTQWTTGIAEIQLPIEFKLKNIEETEAAKKLLHEKRLMGQNKTDSSIPSNHSADYFQRGKDYAEKLRREHHTLYKDGGGEANKSSDNAPGDSGVRRQAATDQLILERFRKRERQRVRR